MHTVLSSARLTQRNAHLRLGPQESFHTFCDFDGDGSISINEFRGAIMEAKRAYLTVEEVQRREMEMMMADPRIARML